MWEKTSWTVGEGGEMPGLSVGSKGAQHRGHSEGKGLRSGDTMLDLALGGGGISIHGDFPNPTSKARANCLSFAASPAWSPRVDWSSPQCLPAQIHED